ncbi:MAG: septum formation initiator family protein [Oscillospiraceae bacterium]|nr:septum formation initiator family protein [Oscillospiraceae bacterium]
MAKRSERNPSKFTRRRKLLFGVVFLVCAYFVYSIVSVQVEIYKQKKQLAEIDAGIEQAQLQNDELSRIANGDEKDYIERIAREKLGYAAADERVFVDTAGVEDGSDAAADGQTTDGAADSGDTSGGAADTQIPDAQSSQNG